MIIRILSGTIILILCVMSAKYTTLVPDSIPDKEFPAQGIYEWISVGPGDRGVNLAHLDYKGKTAGAVTWYSKMHMPPGQMSGGKKAQVYYLGINRLGEPLWFTDFESARRFAMFNAQQ